MHISEFEEFLKEALEDVAPDFYIDTNSRGQIIIYSNLIENDDGDLVKLESDDEEDDDIDPDFEPFADDDDDD